MNVAFGLAIVLLGPMIMLGISGSLKAKNLGLAKNILSARLRNLIHHGVLDSTPASDGSPYQEYVLTQKGRELFTLLVALRQWGEDFCFSPDEAHVVLVDRRHGMPVRRVELRSQDGRVLGPEDTLVIRLSDAPPKTVKPSAAPE